MDVRPMSYEWPLGWAREAALTPASSPLHFLDQVAVIRGSDAIEAFARRRAGQIQTCGHTPQTDLEKSIGHIAAQAQYRLSALHEIVGRDLMNLPRDKRAQCLGYIESAGATLIALWERCQSEVPDEA
jgi:hypothetical protein